jgi:hypothetical protein
MDILPREIFYQIFLQCDHETQYNFYLSGLFFESLLLPKDIDLILILKYQRDLDDQNQKYVELLDECIKELWEERIDWIYPQGDHYGPRLDSDSDLFGWLISKTFGRIQCPCGLDYLIN